MANYKNTPYYTQTTKDTVPASTAGTGTMTGAGKLMKITGGSNSQVQIGGWIYIPAQNEVRRVTGRVSSNTLVIDKPFTTPLSGSAFQYIQRYSSVQGLDVTNTGAANATADGQAIPAGLTVGWSKNSLGSDRRQFTDPIILDATGTTCTVSLLR